VRELCLTHAISMSRFVQRLTHTHTQICSECIAAPSTQGPSWWCERGSSNKQQRRREIDRSRNRLLPRSLAHHQYPLDLCCIEPQPQPQQQQRQQRQCIIHHFERSRVGVSLVGASESYLLPLSRSRLISRKQLTHEIHSFVHSFVRVCLCVY